MIVVICPTYNHAMAKGLCTQLSKQVCSVDVEVVIVDNKGGFTYSQNELIPRGGFTYHCAGANLGYLRGNNRGVELVRNWGWAKDAELFVCCNDDIILSHGFLQALWEERHTFGFYQAAFDDRYFPHCVPTTGTPLAGSYEPIDQATRVGYIDGSCMAITRDTLETVGLFDEAFARYSWGDSIDYSLRCHAAGVPVGVTFRAYYNHLNHTTQGVMHPNYTRDAGQDMRAALSAKHGIENWDAYARDLRRSYAST